MGGGKKQVQKPSKKDRKLSLYEYEKIGKLTIIADWWSSRLFDLSIFLFLLLMYMVLILYFRTNLDEDASLIQLELGIMVLIAIGLLSASVVLTAISKINEFLRQYNINYVIKQYLYELSEKPDEKRKKIIVRHLIYNIWRIRRKYTFSQLMLLNTPFTRMFFKFLRNEDRIKVELIDETVTLIGDSILHWENTEISILYKEIGDCFEDEKVLNLNKIINGNKNKFCEFDRLKEDIEKRKINSIIVKIGIWFSKNYKEIVYALFIITFILYTFKILSAPVNIPI